MAQARGINFQPPLPPSSHLHLVRSRSRQQHTMTETKLIHMLPPELWMRIFEFLPQDAITTMSQIHKFFWDLALPTFWEVLFLGSYQGNAYSKVRRLAKTPELAKYVKTAYIFNYPTLEIPHGQSKQRVITALKRFTWGHPIQSLRSLLLNHKAMNEATQSVLPHLSQVSKLTLFFTRSISDTYGTCCPENETILLGFQPLVSFHVMLRIDQLSFLAQAMNTSPHVFSKLEKLTINMSGRSLRHDDDDQAPLATPPPPSPQESLRAIFDHVRSTLHTLVLVSVAGRVPECFESIGLIPGLRSLDIGIMPLNEKTKGCAEACLEFIKAHRATLVDVCATRFPEDVLHSIWFQDGFTRFPPARPNLHGALVAPVAPTHPNPNPVNPVNPSPSPSSVAASMKRKMATEYPRLQRLTLVCREDEEMIFPLPNNFSALAHSLNHLCLHGNHLGYEDVEVLLQNLSRPKVRDAQGAQGAAGVPESEESESESALSREQQQQQQQQGTHVEPPLLEALRIPVETLDMKLMNLLVDKLPGLVSLGLAYVPLTELKDEDKIAERKKFWHDLQRNEKFARWGLKEIDMMWTTPKGWTHDLQTIERDTEGMAIVERCVASVDTVGPLNWNSTERLHRKPTLY